MVDYSKWEHIELSDDEDETQNAARLMRSAEMNRRIKELQQRKDTYQTSLAQIRDRMESQVEDAELKFALEDIEKEGKAIENEEKKVAQEEQKHPLNVETKSKQGFQKTVINRKHNEPKEQLTEVEREQLMEKFVTEKGELCRQYGRLTKFEDSKGFLEQHKDLVCDETCHYLSYWCINLEIQGEHDSMQKAAQQYICMRHILDAGKKMGLDPRCLVPVYFAKLLENNQECHREFEFDINAFKQHIKQAAQEKIKEAIASRIERVSKEIDEEIKDMAKQPAQSESLNRTEDERLTIMVGFIEKNELLCLQYGKLEGLEDSKVFLEQHKDLVCDETCHYLTYWCINLEMQEDHDTMQKAAHQCMCIRYILEKAKHLKSDPRDYFPLFFANMLDHVDSDFHQQFRNDIKEFQQVIKGRAHMKIQQFQLQQAIEQQTIVNPFEQ